jgi:hypothetical protein
VNFGDDSDASGVRTQTPYVAPTPFTIESQPPGQ